MHVFAALAIALAAGASAQCANKCSGHGSCGNEAICSCYAGYTGGDCSLKQCPEGLPWVGKAFQDDGSGLTHTTSTKTLPCSNAGICDYKTGECQCVGRYTGKACERLNCPLGTNDQTCSGHGRCEDISAIAKKLGPDASVPYYDGTGNTYTNWEKSILYGCVCDQNWYGADCSQRQCPYGDSAQTIGQQRPLYRLLVDFSDVVSPANRIIKMKFASQFSAPFSFASGTPTNAACLSWIASIPALNSSETSCIITPTGTSPLDGASIANNQYEVLISLGLGYSSAIDTFYFYNGKPSASLFSCFFAPAISGLGSGAVTTSSCAVSYVDVTKLTAVSSLPPVGTSYSIRITDTTTTPNKFRATKTVAGIPPATTNYAARDVVIATSGTPLDATDSFTIYFNALVGHTVDAEWTIDSTGVRSNGLREYESCSRAGTCEPIYGVCQCWDGYGGPACDKDLFTFTKPPSAADYSPIQSIVAPTNTYASSILRISSLRPQDPSFNYLEITDPSGPLFTVRGDGYLNVQRIITDGGLTSQTLSAAAASYPDRPTLDIRYASTATAPTNGIARIRSDIAFDSPTITSSSVDIFKVQGRTSNAGGTGNAGDYTSVFSVKNDGSSTFSRSGLTVTDVPTSTKTTVSIGTTTKGVAITGSGTYDNTVTFFDGLTITGPGGANVYNSMKLVKTGATTLTVDQDLDVSSSDTFKINTVDATLALPSGGVAITTGAAVTGTAGSITVTAGGATAGSGGNIAVSAGSTTDTATGTGGFIQLAAGTSKANGGTAGSVTVAAGASTAATTGTGGSMVLSAGASSGDNGGTAGSVTISAGGSTAAATGTGGSIKVAAGGSSGTGGTAGSVTLTAGSSTGTTGTGGSVVIQSGTAIVTASVGNTIIKDAAGGTRVVVAGAGSITVDAIGTLMLKGATATAGVQGGTVSITGGTGIASDAGGDVRIKGGASGGAAGGGVVTVADAADKKRFSVAAATSSFYATDGNAIATFNTGATVAASDISIAAPITGAITVANAVSSATTQTVISTATAGIAITGSGASYSGNYDGILATGPSSGTYNAFKLVKSGAASLTVDQDLDVTSTDNFAIKTADTLLAVNAGAVSLTGGTAVNGKGGSVVVTGGDSTAGNGGSVTIQAGVSASSNAGSVVIKPGSTTTGTAGSVLVKDSAGNDKISVGGTAVQVLADNHAAIATFTTGANVAASSVGVATAMSIAGILTATGGFEKGLITVYYPNGATSVAGGNTATGTSVRFGFNLTGALLTVSYGSYTASVPDGALFPIYS